MLEHTTGTDPYVSQNQTWEMLGASLSLLTPLFGSLEDRKMTPSNECSSRIMVGNQ